MSISELRSIEYFRLNKFKDFSKKNILYAYQNFLDSVYNNIYQECIHVKIIQVNPRFTGLMFNTTNQNLN